MAGLRDAAIAQVVLEGVPLPANKSELLRYARQQAAPSSVLEALERIPAREYAAIDQIGEAIAEVQPPIGRKPVREPKPESGDVPGGSAYVDATAGSGAVRGEPTVLPYEEQLVREPAPVGEGIPETAASDTKPRNPAARVQSG